MDLKKFLPKKEDEEQEYFWALIIEPGWVQAGIWKIYAEKAQVMYSGIPVAWELEEDLVNSVDAALSAAIQNFPEDLAEPSRTVFGVVSSWVEKGEIKREYLEWIKKICSELSLKPLGFAVLSEAISNLIKSEEGSPVSAVLIGIYKESIEVSVFKLGNLLGSTRVARSISLIDDTAEGISRFSQRGEMPSRFLIYDGREAELEESRQLLHSANWEDYESLRFLHPPKIEIVDSRQKIEAISLAGASELANVTVIEPLRKEKTEETEEKKEEKIEEEDYQELTPQEVGFVVNEDIAQKVQPQTTKPSQALEESPQEEVQSYDNLEPIEKDLQIKTRMKRRMDFRFLTLFLNRVKSFPLKFNLFRNYISFGKRSLIFGLTFLVIIFALLFSFWWFYPKAEIVIYVSPRSLSEKFSVTVDPQKSSSSIEDFVLAGEVHESSLTNEKTKQTTGSKTVGERARGRVVIYRAGSEISLPAGTILTGPGNLKFSLDQSVTIASGSASSPGRAEADVTAGDIGAQYNLASGATFSVDDYSLSDIEARNEQSFSGGSSREISAVSKEDQDKLFEELQEEMLDNARKEFLDKIPEDRVFIEDSLTATPSSKIFSSKVGDEAENVSLKMDLKTSGLSVRKDELLDIAERILKDKIPSGFILRKEQFEIDFDLEERGKIYKFEVAVRANLLPQVDVHQLAQKIKGKYPELAQEFLPREVPGFVRAEMKIRPHLPGRLGTLPRLVNNISIEVAVEK